jgi:phenylacetate-CoA ligase
MTSLSQLQNVLERARQAPHYAGRFAAASLASLEDWAALPLTTKEDLRQAYPFGLLAVPPRELTSYHESSGTSGQPISSYFTARDWTDVLTRFLRSRVALTQDDMVLVKTPYSLVTTAHQMHAAAQLAGATVVPADNRSHNMPYARVLRLLRDLLITVAWCMPSEALIWAHLARRLGLDPARDFPSLRAFLVAGESLSPARRAAISRAWGGKTVIEDYGSTETGSLAGECVRGRLHLWDDRLHFEVVNGSLVVTPLQREAMPLVRYDLEDEVRLGTQACECGSAAPTLEVLGRRSGRIEIGDQAFYPRELEQAVYEGGAEHGLWFWRARALAPELAAGDGLEIEFYADSQDSDGAGPAIVAQIARRLGVRAKARAVAATDFLPDTLISAEAPMQKPRFVFSTREDWNKSLVYA